MARLKSIVRRDTGEGWKAYVVRLMREEGVIAPGEEPSDEDVRRFDRNRKDKKVSNEEWVSETDPEAKIARMKDGTTHLAYKAEHVVDLESDLILAAEIRPADHGDQQTLVDSVLKAEENLQAIGCEQSIEEVAADKGYQSVATLELCQSLGFRTYIPEPKRNTDWTWTDKTPDDQRGGAGEPSAGPPGKGQAVAETAERSLRTDLRPRLRDGRHASELARRPDGGDETVPDRDGGAQSRASDVEAAGSWQTAETAGAGCGGLGGF